MQIHLKILQNYDLLYESKGKILILSDYEGSVSIKSDYVINDIAIHSINVNYVPDNVLLRISQDNISNCQCLNLLDLC